MKETLRELRTQNNYSQITVAKYLGISRQMYIKYENGTAEPSVKTIVALSQLYKVSTDIIIENKLKNEPSEAENKADLYGCASHKNINTLSEPAVDYGVQSHLSTVLNLLPKLLYTEQITVMAKLASLIQSESEKMNSLPVKRKQQKLLDEAYVKMLEEDGLSEIVKNNAKRVGDYLKNDEW